MINRFIMIRDLHGALKTFGHRKNETTFTPVKGFKPNFQHYYIILLFSMKSNLFFK